MGRLNVWKSEKNMTLGSHGMGVRRRAGTLVAIPGQGQNFLHFDEKKTDFFQLTLY